MNFQVPDDCLTAATRHPHWWDIYQRIEEHFAGSEDRKLCAIDMASSYFMGDRERYERDKRSLGETAAADVISICRGFCVDIEQW